MVLDSVKVQQLSMQSMQINKIIFAIVDPDQMLHSASDFDSGLPVQMLWVNPVAFDFYLSRGQLTP